MNAQELWWKLLIFKELNRQLRSSVRLVGSHPRGDRFHGEVLTRKNHALEQQRAHCGLVSS